MDKQKCTYTEIEFENIHKYIEIHLEQMSHE